MNRRQVDFTAPHLILKKLNQTETMIQPRDIAVLTVHDVMVLLGVGRSTAYALIAEVRARWPEDHRVLSPGCVSKELFMGQLYGAAPRKENI